VKDAIDALKTRIGENLAKLFSEEAGGDETRAADIEFRDGTITDRMHPERTLSFDEAMATMRLRQVSLSATGFYRTPGIGWDKQKISGHPFHYFAFGMAVSEVEVDILTGRVRLVRTDILHDVGDSLNRGIDLGQVIGGFMQGVGWVTTEEILWDAAGQLQTHSPDTYKIPTASDIPSDLRVSFLDGVPNPGVIGHSKAVGEPPFMLALSVWLAIKDALASIGDQSVEPPFGLPATTEVILLAAEALRRVPESAP
jgi:xanthine dehydrogenase molybdopterin-binding subunit B